MADNSMYKYVFCPHCGAVTYPGRCTMCGMDVAAGVQEDVFGSYDNDVTDRFPSDAKSQGAYRYYTDEPASESEPVFDNVTNYSTTVTEVIPQSVIPEEAVVQTTPADGVIPQSVSANEATSQAVAAEEVASSNGNMPVFGETDYNAYSFGYGESDKTSAYQTEKMNAFDYNREFDTIDTSNDGKTKKKVGIFLVVFLGSVLGVGGLALVCIVVAIVFLFSTALVNTGSSSSITSTYPPTTTLPTTPTEEREVYSLEKIHDSSGNVDWTVVADEFTSFQDGRNPGGDLFLVEDYMSTFDSDHVNQPRTSFTGIYYEPFCESIDYNQDYVPVRYILNASKTNAAGTDQMEMDYAYIAYYQLESDNIPNLDSLNAEIKEITAGELLKLVNGQTDPNNEQDVGIEVDSFITYNDEVKMSILLDVNLYMDGYREVHYIHGINIDLENGVVLDNSSIANIDDTFVSKFLSKCESQNGSAASLSEYMTDEEIFEFLTDAETNIIFFSPYGLEIGFGAIDEYGNWGWSTITILDMVDYLNDQRFASITDPSLTVSESDVANKIITSDEYFQNTSGSDENEDSTESSSEEEGSEDGSEEPEESTTEKPDDTFVGPIESL